MQLPRIALVALSALTAIALSACGERGALQPANSLNGQSTAATASWSSDMAAKRHRRANTPIQHVIIIVQENRSLDDLFQGYPGANTASSGLNSKGQTVPLTAIPLEALYDIDHSFSTWIVAHDKGKMDHFDKEGVYGSQAHKYPNPQYGYVPQGEIGPYLAMANQYVLGDNMYTSDIDGSFVAHQYLIAAQSNSEVNYPTGAWGCPGGSHTVIHQLTQQRQITQSTVSPCQDYQTLADEMDTAGVSWHMYAPTLGSLGTDWSAFQAINHIYNGTDWKTDVISPETKFLTDVPAGTLENVTWVIPSLKRSDHALSGSNEGPTWVANVVNTIGESQFWSTSVIFIVWDDWGGWYDHVAPPHLDYDGLGFRVPFLCISPYAVQGVVSHTQYEFGSILRFVENNFGLAQLAASDTRATPADQGCLNYSQSPRQFTPFTTSLKRDYFLHEAPSSRAPDDE